MTAGGVNPDVAPAPGSDAEHEPSLAERCCVAFEAYRLGDRDRMGELVTTVSPILWHTVRTYRLDAQAAEDVVQTTWLALVRSAHTVQDPRAVLQWLIVTARREAWRVSGTQRKVEPTDFEGEDLVAPADDEPETRTVQGARDDHLWRAVGELSERCQRLLRVIAFADRPDYAAVSRALGMPVGSIGPTRGRCLAQLRVVLSSDPGLWTS